MPTGLMNSSAEITGQPGKKRESRAEQESLTRCYENEDDMKPERLINAAIYAWDMYLVTGKTEYLKDSADFLRRYREAGGDLYQETEKHINAAMQRMKQ